MNARYGTAAILLAAFLAVQGCATAGRSATAATQPTGAAAAGVGPTLSLSPWRQGEGGIPAREFLYFVPLISREPVEYHASPGNSQQAHLISSECTPTGADGFTLCCCFELVGEGYSEHAIDPAEIVRRHAAQLQAGGRLSHILGSIRMEGAGRAILRATGVFEDGRPIAHSVAMAFSSHDGASPIRIALDTISGPPDACVVEPEALADVAVLRFVRDAAPAQMAVTLAAVHAPEATDTATERLMGLLKGAVANVLIPPVDIDAAGNLAILDFAAALAAGAPTYTFPYATKLRQGDLVGARPASASSQGHEGG